MDSIKINKKYITIKMTHEEANQLIGLCKAANAHGDHIEWMQSAKATKKELSALKSIYEKITSLTKPTTNGK